MALARVVSGLPGSEIIHIRKTLWDQTATASDATTKAAKIAVETTWVSRLKSSDNVTRVGYKPPFSPGLLNAACRQAFGSRLSD